MSTLGWIFLLIGFFGLLMILLDSITPHLRPRKKPIKPDPIPLSQRPVSLEISNELVPSTAPKHLSPDVSAVPPLPHSYEYNKLVALVQTPTSIYVYWDLDRSNRQGVFQHPGKKQVVLRVHDITHPETWQSWDIIINESVNNWYVDVPHANGKFFFTLGVILMDDTFVEVLRSNTLNMPRNQVSDQIDREWPPIAGIQYMLGTNPTAMVSSQELLKSNKDFPN